MKSETKEEKSTTGSCLKCKAHDWLLTQLIKMFPYFIALHSVACLTSRFHSDVQFLFRLVFAAMIKIQFNFWMDGIIKLLMLPWLARLQAKLLCALSFFLWNNIEIYSAWAITVRSRARFSSSLQELWAWWYDEASLPSWRNFHWIFRCLRLLQPCRIPTGMTWYRSH